MSYVWQLELAKVSIKGWIINSNQYCLFDGPGNIMVLPAHYAEVVQRHLMTSDVVMFKDGDGALMCSLNLSPKVLPDSPMYSLLQSTLLHLYL